MIEFRVDGRPYPKGSDRWVTSKTTGRSVKAGPRKRADGTKAPDYLKGWTQAIQVEARKVVKQAPHFGPVFVKAEFAYERPKNHYRTGRNSDKLKHQVTEWPTSGYYADLDKLERALLDALTGIVWVDDRQVVAIDSDKTFGTPGVDVTIELLDS